MTAFGHPVPVRALHSQAADLNSPWADAQQIADALPCTRPLDCSACSAALDELPAEGRAEVVALLQSRTHAAA